MDKTERYNVLCGNLYKTYLKKNHDYGDSFSQTFKKFGIISALVRISDKYNRLVSLIEKNNNLVKDETIEDTLLDLAGYCLMTVLEINSKKEK